MNEFLGVYAAPGRDIPITSEMPREDMWYVLKELMAEYETQRRAHHATLDFMTRLAKRR